MQEFFLFLLLALFLGPPVALPFGEQFFGLGGAVFLLICVYVAPLPFFFRLLDRLDYSSLHNGRLLREMSFLLRRSEARVSARFGKLVSDFDSRWGDLGYLLALAWVTFFFGIYMACLLAFILRVERGFAIFSIALGAVSGVLFWTFVIFLGFESPGLLPVLGVLVAALFVLWGRRREFSVLKSVLKKK